MKNDCVCAVVVTFHPAEEVLAHLTAIRGQVDHLIVVDNGSLDAELAPLRALSSRLGFDLDENGENLGIAAGLNIGIRRAMAAGGWWVFLFDQDSCATDGFVAAMVRAYRESRWGGRLKLLMPRYVDKRNGRPLPAPKAAEGLAVATTSGSLTEMETFRQFGLFAEELFIDQVDYEFSLRLRKAGCVIDETADAVLLHSPGEPTVYRFLGIGLFHTPNYGPLRRYYQERNKIWIARRYRSAFPLFCVGLFFASGKDLLKLLLAETQKWMKCKYIVYGIADGIRGRMGKFRERR